MLKDFLVIITLIQIVILKLIGIVYIFYFIKLPLFIEAVTGYKLDIFRLLTAFIRV